MVKCGTPNSYLLQSPRICRPGEDHCCNCINQTTLSRSLSRSVTPKFIPKSQIIVKEYLQGIGVTTLVMLILGTASIVTVLLVLAFARHREHEARNLFLDSIYG
jgi:hypothetical protein